ncbi:hypothetical protein DFJ74DRAFT_656276 [Hyaloraphidium curvatum]|nr:hypothetical protein DFJ74DRAFT_656276 [Hyaloraphidium curvatum]
MKVFDELNDALRSFIREQHLFFVASAPLNGGHINVSPKGHPSETLVVVEKQRLAYLDMTGSGVETISHIREPGNGRLVMMWTSFGESPNIVRAWGKGSVAEVGTEAFARIVGDKPLVPGTRAVVALDIEKVSTSCGYSIPRMQYVGERETLKNWATVKLGQAPENDKFVGTLGSRWEEYCAVKNAQSLDGLKGLEVPQKKAGISLGDDIVGPPVFQSSRFGSLSPPAAGVDWTLVPAAAYILFKGVSVLQRNALLGVVDLLAAVAIFLPRSVPKASALTLLAGVLGSIAAKRNDRTAVLLGLLVLAASARRG